MLSNIKLLQPETISKVFASAEKTKHIYTFSAKICTFRVYFRNDKGHKFIFQTKKT